MPLAIPLAMQWFLPRRRLPATTALINDIPIEVQPRETILQAALRNKIDFPHSCRVGGCATCKCRLLEGQVKALTRSAYVLSDKELDQGYILACQSVPRGDVSIAVDISAHRAVQGRVVAQHRLTPDITRLCIQLNEPLPYKGGQFAHIGVESLPDVRRSYSFATRAQSDWQVSFFVRKVPGGAFSSHINDANVVGQRATIEGPVGSFCLRPADAPLLMVAGGSGLAPILAMLEDALAEGFTRPVTLLFGARKTIDLYAMNAIQDIARKWPGSFRFLPVLSAETDSSSWSGLRGLVTNEIPRQLVPDAHAYLCGPPPMIDSAVALLLRQGVPRQHIHTDRFTTRHEAHAAA